MSLVSRITDLATRIATEIKAVKTLVNGNAADLVALNTTAKTNLVAAINEVKTAADNAASSGGAQIDDAVTASDTVWSSDKTNTEITSAVAAVVDAAPGALDTLNELAAAIGDDANFASTVTTALGNRVRVDTAAQGLTTTQQGNARTNIGAQASADIGNTETNFVTTFNAGLL